MKEQTLGLNWAVERRTRKRYGTTCLTGPFKVLEVGTLKWCKEHVPRDGNDWTEEGQMLLDDPELCLDHLAFSWECHTSRKRDRTTEDGTFLLHKKDDITSTFTGGWLLTEGESRLKKTQIRYQDQRRMLQSIMHYFPSNFWRSKITNGKESDKCDLCERCGYCREGSPQSQFFQFRL
jgi:hypothetical protein